VCQQTSKQREIFIARSWSDRQSSDLRNEKPATSLSLELHNGSTLLSARTEHTFVSWSLQIHQMNANCAKSLKTMKTTRDFVASRQIFEWKLVRVHRFRLHHNPSASVDRTSSNDLSPQRHDKGRSFTVNSYFSDSDPFSCQRLVLKAFYGCGD
jgi:hypothetical protein